MKIRNPKSEVRRKFKIQISKLPGQHLHTLIRRFEFRSFGFVSDFGFRVSDLRHAFGALCLFAATSSFAADLKKDEELIFFPVIAQQVAKGTAWEAEIHGWVFEPERRTLELELFRTALKVKKEEMTEAENVIFTERARTFMVDNERGKDVSIRIGDKTYPVGKSAASGHVLGRIRLSNEEVEALRKGAGGSTDRITFYAVTPQSDARVFAGEIHLIADAGVSVISDIDDTIKVTEVRDQHQLLLNTFFRPFKPVDGMAAVYQAWAKNAGAKFHYVSASPWQLYPSLADFILSNDFPVGTFHLKQFRWKDETFLKLFESPEEYKPGVIEPMLKRFPNRRFVLVGDSGEKDPEIYGNIARRFPKQVTRVLIRDVTNEVATSERYQKAFKGVPAGLWKVFRDPKEVADIVLQ